MFSNYIIYILGSDSAKKYCNPHFPIFGPDTLFDKCLQTCDNFEFSEKYFRSHDGRGKILINDG